MTKIFVTGALGFIGSYLIPYLTRQGHKVVSSDVHVRDYDDYVRADVTSFEDLYKIFKKENVKQVIHMAGEVGRMVGEEHPQKMMYVNNIGTLNLIKLCLEFKARLVYFSTSEVYGRLFDKNEPVKEADLEKASVFTTTNIYAMSKLFGEAIVRHYVENYGLNAATVRPFMVYGPGEHPSKYRSALINFVHSALNGEKITVHKGAQRAWCYISDFVRGVHIVMQHPFSGKYEAFNVGSNEYHTMEETAQMVIEECGADSNLIDIVEPPKKFLSLNKMFSIEKMRNLGYEPQVSLKEGIQRVAKWQKKEMGDNSADKLQE
jgi:nucleoside-diphosphate-sugar epimerase